ncbi:hypothetical protein FGRMN_2835 [Fusarium graminum]|nr:hypothetical protein FGRMN_2835 [Fusarium graminum]
MRPVLSNELRNLLIQRPLLLFNQTLFGPAFVDNIVRRSPPNITSKGGKRLPLEIWYCILEFSHSSEAHDYALVRPQIIARGTNGGKELVCQKFKRWTSFGTIRILDNVENYNFLLAHPDRLYPGYLDPSNSPQSRDDGRSVSIPVETFNSKGLSKTYHHIDSIVENFPSH